MTSNLYLLFSTPIKVRTSIIPTVISTTVVVVSMRSLFQREQHRAPEFFFDTPPSYDHISGVWDAIYHCPWVDNIKDCFEAGLKKNPIIRPLTCSLTENNLMDIAYCSLGWDQKTVEEVKVTAEKVKVTAFLILLGVIWYATLPTGNQNKEKVHP